MMNIRTLELDISKGGVGGSVTVGQGDDGGTTIKALIYDNGAEFSLSDSTVWLVALLPNKRNYYRGKCTVSGNAATHVVDEVKLCSVPGYTDEAYFTVTKGGSTYSTERFAIEILRSALDGQQPAESWDNEIDDLIENMKNVLEETGEQMESQQAAWEKQTESQKKDFEGSQERREEAYGKAEAARDAAFSDAESKRQEAESGRIEAEKARVSAESERVDAEAKRKEAESARIAGESNRLSAEKARSDAEAARSDAESARAAAEARRSDAETSRHSAEQARVKAEASRESADRARAEADSERETRQAKNDADQAMNNEAARNSQPKWLGEGQYDPETLVPTVEKPVEGALYLVPLSRVHAMAALAALKGSRHARTAVSLSAVEANGSEESLMAASEGGNAYVEWLWHASESRWEQIGVSQKQVAYITTDEIDAVAADQSPSGESVLGLTGLSYLWAKIKAAFSPKSHAHSASDITGGTLPIERGGTGAGSALAANRAILAGSVAYTSLKGDESDFAVYSTAPSDAHGAVGKVKGSLVYAWLKGKFDALYAKVSHSHSAADIESGTLSAARLPFATASVAGAMSAADKKKLDGIAAGANKYVLQAATGSTLGGVKLSDSTASSSGAGSGVAATPAAVKAVADELDEFRDSVSQATADTGWVDIWVAENIAIKARRIGSAVFVSGECYGTKEVGTDWTTVTTLPEGFRPDMTVYTAGFRISSSAGGAVGVRVSASGLVSMIAPGDSASYWAFGAAFPAA